MKGNRIYICYTYYHVLVSLIKEISFNKEADIVICDNIPEFEKLIDKLNEYSIFKNVFMFNEKRCKEDSRNYNISGKFGIIFANYKFKKFIKPLFELKKSTYKEVYIFHDFTYLGYYLRANRIYYNLLEDAKDSYKVLDNYIKIDYYKSLKHRIFGFAFETLYFHGKSKYSKIVEVNDDQGIRIPKEKIKVRNKKEMFDNLAEGQKLEIYKIFTGNKGIGHSTSENGVLILTQPLFEDSLVKSEEVQRKVYEDIIDKYCVGFDIVIKPHPRDDFNYKKEFYNITVMDKNLPTEILNFNTNIKYKKAITVTSSSINAIDFAEDKVYLGFDWLKKYQ